MSAITIPLVKSLFDVAKEFFSFFNNKNKEEKKLILEAHLKVREAYILTCNYLINKKGKYKSNIELAKAWNIASTEVLKLDDHQNLGYMLRDKSSFWTYPELYIKEGRQDDIIELNQLIEEMEMLLIQIK